MEFYDAERSMALKNLNDFWRSFEMLFFNCKVQLKLELIKCCVLAAAGVIVWMLILIILFYYQKHKATCPCRHFISKKNHKLSKIVRKRSESLV